MSFAIVQKSNLDGFVKPGELINIKEGETLSLQDRRVFNMLIENAWSEIGEDKSHQIAIAKLRGPRHKGSERVAESVETLMTTLVKVPTKINGEDAIFETQLLGPIARTIDENSPNAVLVYEFPKQLRKIIQDSRYWGRIKAFVMFAFTSKYALALYEAVCLRGNLQTNVQMFTVEAFRVLLGVEPGKYRGFPQLKQKVITPAVSEINALSDFNVEVRPIREGGLSRGTLTGFELMWEKKDNDEWMAVLDELGRPKVGRKARISGKVETVSGLS